MMNYVAEVTTCILSHCCKTKLLGPEVYAAIAEWEKEGVPLELVRASINEAFRETVGRNDRTPPIALIKGVVVHNFNNWLAQSG